MDTFDKSANRILASINTTFGLQISLRNPWSFLANMKFVITTVLQRVFLIQLGWQHNSSGLHAKKSPIVYVNSMKPSYAYTRR